MRRIHLLDQRFGKLVVIGEGEPVQTPAGPRRRWKCLCDCGNITHVATGNLRRPTGAVQGTRSCGCNARFGDRHPLWKGVGAVSKSYFHRIRSNAALRGHAFDLSLQYIADLFETQGRLCAITGLPLGMPHGARELNTKNDAKTASLDRIDSSRGYVAGNVQWVHKTINMMKREMPQHEFIKWCQLVEERTRANAA